MKKILIAWIAGNIIFTIIVHIAYKIEASCLWMVYEINPGELLTFVSTTALGGLAFWQNNQILERERKKEESRYQVPLFLIKEIKEEEFECIYYKSRNSFEIHNKDTKKSINIILENIGEGYAFEFSHDTEQLGEVEEFQEINHNIAPNESLEVHILINWFNGMESGSKRYFEIVYRNAIGYQYSQTFAIYITKQQSGESDEKIVYHVEQLSCQEMLGDEGKKPRKPYTI